MVIRFAGCGRTRMGTGCGQGVGRDGLGSEHHRIRAARAAHHSPGGATVAVNFVIVYEEGSEYSLIEGHGRNDGWGEYALTVDPPIPDLGTETHFEYGSRVGIWRLARMLGGQGVKATISACALALERNPEVPAWMHEAGHDLLGHGWRWFEAFRQTRAEEPEHPRLAVESYRRTLGYRPIGWNQWSYPSVNTFDLLAEEGGFLYTSDPCNDEIPCFVPDGRGGRMLEMPYSKTFNDSRFLIAPGYSNPGDFAADVTAGWIPSRARPRRSGHG